MPIYPVTNNKTGKTYDMPWDKDGEPTAVDAMQYIDSIEHPGMGAQISSAVKSGWNKLNEPLMDLPSRAAKVVSKPLWDYGESHKGTLGDVARGAGAWTDALGDIGSASTSPLQLGLMATTGGASLAASRGAAGAAQALSIPGRIAAGGMVAHGGYNALRPGSTTAERLGGVVEGGLGALGLRGPEVKPPIPDIAEKPFGPQLNPETGMGPVKNNFGTNRPGNAVQDGVVLGENPPPPGAPKQIGPYVQPQLPPAPDTPPPTQLGLPPKKPVFYGGPAGGPLAENIDEAPTRVFAGGAGSTPPGRMPARSFSAAQGMLRPSPALQDVTPKPPIRDILEQNSPYGQIMRGGATEPPSTSPQFAGPRLAGPKQPLGDITPQGVSPAPVEAPPIAKPKPAPVKAAPVEAPASPVKAAADRPFAKTSDADIEFLAQTGEPGALDEARLRPSLKEKLGYLFKQAPDVKGQVGGAAIPDIAQEVSGKPVTGPVEAPVVSPERPPAKPTPAPSPTEAPVTTPSPATPSKPAAGPTPKPPVGEPGSPERYKYIAWEHEQTAARKASKLEGLKGRDPSTINWGRDWEPDTRVKSMADAQAEVDYFKNRAEQAKKAVPTGETVPAEETSPALDDRSFVQKFLDRTKNLATDETGSVMFGKGEYDNLAKANKIKAKDWATQREAANLHGEFAKNDFKDLADKPELIDRFQSGDRSGRLADVQAHFDKLYQDEVDAGIFSGKKMSKENYLRQTYKPELVDEETSPAVRGGVVPKTPAFAKKSTYATFAEARAAGHEPLYDNLADIIGARTVESKRAIANKKFDTYLNETAQKTPEMTIKEPTQLHYSGPMHDQLSKYTSNVLQDSPDWLHNIASGVAKTKNIYLAGGIPGTPLNIHGYNIARSRYMASGIKGIGDFTKGIFNPSGDIAYLKSERPLIQKALDYGYQMSSENETEGTIEKALSNYKLGRLANKGMDLTQKLFEDPLFKVSLPANKARVLRENYDRLLPKVGEEQALRQASTIANDFMGGINKSLRDKTLKDALQIGILAPDWAESRINLAVKGAKAMVGKEDPIYAKALARGGVMRGAGAAAQLGIGDDRGNKPSDLTSVGLGKTESGKFRELPIYGTAVEGLRIPEEAARGAMTGDFSPLARILRNRTSQPVQSLLNIGYTGTDAFGNPMSGKDKYNRPIPFGTALANYGTEAAAPFTPQQLQSLTGYVRGKQGVEESASQALELPLKYSTPPSFGTARRSRSRSRSR